MFRISRPHDEKAFILVIRRVVRVSHERCSAVSNVGFFFVSSIPDLSLLKHAECLSCVAGFSARAPECSWTFKVCAACVSHKPGLT
jgi:hypothetical protein